MHPEKGNINRLFFFLESIPVFTILVVFSISILLMAIHHRFEYVILCFCWVFEISHLFSSGSKSKLKDLSAIITPKRG